MKIRQIALITMCAMLALTVIMAGIVVGRVSPVLNALLGTNNPTDPSTSSTTQPSSSVPPSSSSEPPVSSVPSTQPSSKPTTSSGHVHEFQLSSTQQATCQEAGFSVYACQCGEKEIKDLVPARNHSFGVGKKISPTCEEKGCTRFTCTVCKQEVERDYQEPLGHDFVFTETVEGSCTQDGYDEYTCSREDCGGVEKRNEQKAPGQHEFSDWEITVDPEPGKPGQESRECTACKEKETRDMTLILNRKETADPDEMTHHVIALSAINKKGEPVVVYTYEIFCPKGIRIHVNYILELSISYSVEVEDDLKHFTRVLTPGETITIGADGQLVESDGEEDPPATPET